MCTCLEPSLERRGLSEIQNGPVSRKTRSVMPGWSYPLGNTAFDSCRETRPERRQGEWLILMTLCVAEASVHRCWLLTLSSNLLSDVWFVVGIFFPPPWFFFQSRRSGRYLLSKKCFCFVLVTCYFILGFSILLFYPEFHVFSWRYRCLAAGS